MYIQHLQKNHKLEGGLNPNLNENLLTVIRTLPSPTMLKKYTRQRNQNISNYHHGIQLEEVSAFKCDAKLKA